MAVLLSFASFLLPVILRGAKDGTLAEIVETALKLIGLLAPLAQDPRTLAELDGLRATLASLAPAQPEHPAMTRVAPDHKFGGR